MDARAMAALALTWAAAAPAQEYTGSKTCAGCHQKIYADYLRTPMGRSMSPASEHLSKVSGVVTVTSDKLNRRYQVFALSGDLYQSHAGPQFRSVHRLDFAVGSGTHGISFIVRRSDHLFQAPLSYYSSVQSWNLSPGYEFADYGFSRPVHAACISCHSGRPRPVAGRNGQYLDPPFQEMVIGCENCHGPGGRHVRSAGAKQTIVNPGKLAPALADDICMRCHQGGDARILQPGKTELDFRPGTPLTDTIAIFKIPRTRDSPPDADLLEHHESMRLSRCFRHSQTMSCLSCHNPHARVTNYRLKCLACHEKDFPNSHPARDSDCTGCHMPKRAVGFIAHTALTNHRIVRTPDAPLPEAAFQQTTEDLPDLVHFNRVPGRTLPELTLLQAYGQLLERQPAYYARYRNLLERLSRTRPDEPLVCAALGRRALMENRNEEAAGYLTKAAALGSTASTTYEDLGEALSRLRRLEDAVKALERGIQLAPFHPVLRKSLVLRLIQLGHYDRARKELEQYVELFPEDDFVRGLLLQVSSPQQR